MKSPLGRSPPATGVHALPCAHTFRTPLWVKSGFLQTQKNFVDALAFPTFVSELCSPPPFRSDPARDFGVPRPRAPAPHPLNPSRGEGRGAVREASRRPGSPRDPGAPRAVTCEYPSQARVRSTGPPELRGAGLGRGGGGCDARLRAQGAGRRAQGRLPPLHAGT